MVFTVQDNLTVMHTYSYIYTFTHTWKHVCVHAWCMCTHTHHLCMYTQTYNAYMNAHTCTHTHTGCTCMHAHTHTHIHTHKQDLVCVHTHAQDSTTLAELSTKPSQKNRLKDGQTDRTPPPQASLHDDSKQTISGFQSGMSRAVGGPAMTSQGITSSRSL